jgi:hypothetical protein
MTTQSNDTFVLRDGDGNIYLISRAVLEAGRVPDDKKAALQKALEGEVSGYGLNFGNILSAPSFQTAVTTLGQSNTASANNVILGVGLGNSQAVSQVGANVANINTGQGRG